MANGLASFQKSQKTTDELESYLASASAEQRNQPVQTVEAAAEVSQTSTRYGSQTVPQNAGSSLNVRPSAAAQTLPKEGNGPRKVQGPRMRPVKAMKRMKQMLKDNPGRLYDEIDDYISRTYSVAQASRPVSNAALLSRGPANQTKTYSNSRQGTRNSAHRLPLYQH